MEQSNMKKIFLTDRATRFVDMILQNTDWQICVLVVDSVVQKNIYEGHPRVLNIFTEEEFWRLENVEDIDYDDIKKYKHIQSACDMGARRVQDDFQFSRYQFYMGIAVWRRFFSQFDVTLCLVIHICHGFRCDQILAEMAKERGIPCYFVGPHSGSDTRTIYSIQKKDYLQMNEGTGYMDDMTINRIIHYSIPYERPSNVFKRLIYHIGGISLLKIMGCIYRRSTKLPIHYNTMSIFTLMKRYVETRWIQSRNQKRYQEINYEKKYIVYFLHLEPEAVLVHYTDGMDSQLIAIQMLAASLPKDWELYVKEHPDSYKINKDAERWNEVSVYPVYYSDYFFKKISSIPKVKLVDVRIPAKDLIINSMGVAGFSGTVILESVLAERPLLLFSDKRKLVYGREQNIFFVYSVQECREVLKRIQDGFRPDYTNLRRLLYQYTFDNDEWEKVLCRLVEDLEITNDGSNIG